MWKGLIASVLVGLALWAIAAALAGGREPWDVGAFWIIFWPAAIALSFGLGALFPHFGWFWGFVVMAMMMPVMAWNGSGLSLLPLGMILIVFLSIPGCLAGLAGGGLRRRFTRG
jgi:hypothetical protein